MSNRIRDAHLRRQLAFSRQFRLRFRSVSVVHATETEGSTESFVLEALSTVSMERVLKPAFNLVRGLSETSRHCNCATSKFLEGISKKLHDRTLIATKLGNKNVSMFASLVQSFFNIQARRWCWGFRTHRSSILRAAVAPNLRCERRFPGHERERPCGHNEALSSLPWTCHRACSTAPCPRRRLHGLPKKKNLLTFHNTKKRALIKTQSFEPKTSISGSSIN
jgi:hypothetical protein